MRSTFFHVSHTIQLSSELRLGYDFGKRTRKKRYYTHQKDYKIDRKNKISRSLQMKKETGNSIGDNNAHTV